MFFFWMVKLYSLQDYWKLQKIHTENCDTVSRAITKVFSLAHTGVRTHMLICVLVGPISAPLLVFLSGGLRTLFDPLFSQGLLFFCCFSVLLSSPAIPPSLRGGFHSYSCLTLGGGSHLSYSLSRCVRCEWMSVVLVSQLWASVASSALICAALAGHHFTFTPF